MTNQPITDIQADVKRAERAVADRFSHYYRDVRHLEKLDVYRFLDLFNVTDQAIGHAIKKLVAAGQRGSKTAEQDIREAIATLERKLGMVLEDQQKIPGPVAPQASPAAPRPIGEVLRP